MNTSRPLPSSRETRIREQIASLEAELREGTSHGTRDIHESRTVLAPATTLPPVSSSEQRVSSSLCARVRETKDCCFAQQCPKCRSYPSLDTESTGQTSSRVSQAVVARRLPLATKSRVVSRRPPTRYPIKVVRRKTSAFCDGNTRRQSGHCRVAADRTSGPPAPSERP